MSTALSTENETPMPILFGSNVNVKVKLSRHELNTVLNYIVAENFGSGLTYEDGYKIMSKIDGPVDIQARQQQILVQLPVSVEISPSGIFSSFKVNGALQFHFTSNFDILENKLSFKTELSHHQWKKKPVVNVFGVNIPIEAIGNYIIRKYKQQICNSIDESIHQNIQLDSIRTKLGNYFKKPVYSYYENEIHVFANPIDLALSPLSMSAQNLEIPLTFYFESVISDSIPEEFNQTCNFSMRPHFEDKSSLHIQSRIPLEFIDSLIKTQVVNNNFGSGLSKIKVLDSKLNGQNQTMYITLVTEGAFKGELLLSFDPVFESVTRQIILQDFNIKAVKGKGLNKIIFSVVKGIAESRIKKTIEDQLNNTLKEFESNIHQMLDRKEIMEGTELNGSLKNYSLSKMQFFKQKLFFNINAELEMEAIISNINTEKLILNKF